MSEAEIPPAAPERRLWGAADGLAAKLDAFVSGGASFVAALGIPFETARTFMAVMVIAFAATSLDTGARIQRLVGYVPGRFEMQRFERDPSGRNLLDDANDFC